ncbi:hypothetical protein ACOSQ2_006481 [Xanthoceras sorbifolium]
MNSGRSSPGFSGLRDSCLNVINDEELETQLLRPPEDQVIDTAAYESNMNPDVEVLAPPLTKRRKLVSKVWEVFTTITTLDGKEWAICKHCDKKYARSSKKETSNLLKHMGKCPSRRNGDQEKLAHEMTVDTTPVVNNNIASDKELNRLNVARMIIRHRCPWSMVEQDFSKAFLNTLQQQPTFKFQSQSTLKADILQVYKEEKEKLCRFLSETSGRFSLTINFWGLDSTFRFFFFITLHFIDNDWELKKKILAFKKLEFWGDYWKKFKAFKSMLLDWNIDKKLCCVTAQNMEEEDKIVREMKLWLTYQDSVPLRGKVTHCGCFIHIVNLLVDEGLLEVKDVFEKIMVCNSYIFSTPENDRKFRIAVEYVKFDGKEVISEEVPKNSTCSIELLEKVLRFREAFRLLQVTDIEFTLNPSPEEWDKITRVYKCLKVLAEVVQSISSSGSSSRCLTTNVFFPKVCSIYRSLCQWGKSDSSDIRLMAYKLKKKFDDAYWSKCHLVLAIAVVLDPRFKFDIVKSWYLEIYGQEAEKCWKRIQDTLEEVYKEYAAGGFKNSISTSSPSLFADASTLNNTDYNMLDHLGMPLLTTSQGSDSGKSQISELDRYLEEPKFRLVQEFDILSWWCVNTPNFPTLANMARDFLAIPMSAALANPKFISDVLKIDPVSSDLDSEIMEALICVPDWLQIPEK